MTGVPPRAGAPPRRRMRLRTPHLCLDVRAEAIYWASANASRRGLEPAAWGRIARDGALGVDEQLARLAAQGIGSEHRCETGVRSAGAQHERATLPALSRGELRAVVRRRSEELAARAGAAQCTASLSARGEQGAALWLVGVDEAESERERETWLRRGFPLARLQSRHLALGQLVRCLAPLAEGEVVAIFDIEPETGTCVLADRAGWIFSREVPLRFMGRGPSARGARSEPTPAALTPDDPSIRVLEGASAAEGESAALATQPIAEEEERDPLEDIAIQAERLATELRRTFRYVEGRIGAQPVSRVILAGELTELIDLGPALGAQLGLPVEVLANGQGDDARPVGGAAVVLGMACAPSASGGNLLAPPVQRALAARRLRRRLQRGLAVAALGAAAAGLAVALEAGSLSLRLDSLERAWAADADARALVAAGQAAAQRASELEHAFAQLDAPQPSAAALLRALSLQVPDEAALQRLRIEPGEQGTLLELTLDASGATMASAAQSVSDFARELAQAPFVRVDVVEPEAEGAPPEPNAAPRVRFRVVGELAAVAPDAGVGGER